MYHNGLKSFYCWLIANLGIVSFIVLSLFICLINWSRISSIDLEMIWTFRDFFDLDIDNESPRINTFGILCAPLVIGAFLMFPTKDWLSRFGRYAILLVACFAIPLFREYAEFTEEELASIHPFVSQYVRLFLFANFIAFFIAIDAYQYFDEMVSRRMLYRNSSSMMFEAQWAYTISIFLESTSILIGMFMVIKMWRLMWIGLSGEEAIMEFLNNTGFMQLTN